MLVADSSQNGYGGTGTYELQLGPAITGHVYCRCDSNAIAGASVKVGNYSATTDTNGAYTLAQVPPGTYTNVVVSATHYASLTTNITELPNVAVTTEDFYLTNSTLVIKPIFDPSITSDANARAITNSIKAAIQDVEQYLATPMCLQIRFVETNSGVSGSSARITNILYTQPFLSPGQSQQIGE
jgi:hypothetical protein